MIQIGLTSKYADVDEVFKRLSIPDIQTLEVELRSGAAQKSSDLRVLVGESYRDLLTTADTIVSMRNMTLLLRRQLNTFMTTCDPQVVSKKLENMSSFPRPSAAVKQRVVLDYLSELRFLVVHFLKKGDLLMSSRLYAIGRLIGGSAIRLHPDIGRRLKSTRALLMRAVNRCGDIRMFSCSFAVIESASPAACLKYFLSLQLSNFADCKTIQDLASSILRMIDSTANFGRLSDAFEQIARQALIKSVQHVLEFDFSALETSLTDELRSYKLYLRHGDLLPSEIGTQVNMWIETSTSSLRDLTSQVLKHETSLDQVVKLTKITRNTFYEASQQVVYDTILPAIEEHISSLLESSIVALSDTESDIARVIDHAEAPQGLWSSKVPWSRGSLQNFQQVVRRTMYSESTYFTIFERKYNATVRMLKDYLAVLRSGSELAARLEAYMTSVQKCFSVIFGSLQRQADETGEPNKILCIMRMISFLKKTVPQGVSTEIVTSSFFIRLLPDIGYRPSPIHSSVAFEKGLPLSLSHSMTQHLMAITCQVSSFGIDIVGIEERSTVRKLIAENLDSITMSLLEAQTGDPSSTENIDINNTVEHQELGGHYASPPMVKPELKMNGLVPVDVDSQRTPALYKELDVPVLSVGTNQKDQVSSGNEYEPSDSNRVAAQKTNGHSATRRDATSTNLQNYFDFKFVASLFQVSKQREELENLVPDTADRSTIDVSIAKAVFRHKVLFKSILS